MPARLARLLAVVTLLIVAGAVGAGAQSIAEVRSPGGISALLVEDHSAPTVSLVFRFNGGAAEDPPDKIGLAHFMAEMFFEGAGRWNTDSYLARWDELGAIYSFEARMSAFKGSLRVLKRDLDRSAELMRLAFAEPRYDRDAIGRVRATAIADADRSKTDAQSRAYDSFYAEAYGNHPLAHRIEGTRDGLTAVTAKDVAEVRERLLTKDGLTVAAVGDLTPAELGALIDKIFGVLPMHGKVAPTTGATMQHGHELDMPMEASQAEVVFGLQLADLAPEQTYVARILNYIVGGSAFTSRLYKAVREKRGLAYSIGTDLEEDQHTYALVGDFGSQPKSVGEAVGVLKEELGRLATGGLTKDELDEAKTALAGDFLRGLVKQSDLASELCLRLQQGYGKSYVQDYASRLDAVTLDEVNDLARRNLDPKKLVIVTVGAPSTSQ